MSFRIEEKIILRKSDDFKVKKFIFKNNGKVLYPKRKISSVYFDNKYFQSFKDSEEGCVPRKKIRIRNYNDLNEYLLETKITSNEGKFKKSKMINESIFSEKVKKGIFDSTYGFCRPIIEISYIREYYNIGKFRLTLDNQIKYKAFKGNSFSYDNLSLILEIKTNSLNTIDEQFKIIPMQRNRFSKYCQGIEAIFGKPHLQRYLQR